MGKVNWKPAELPLPRKIVNRKQFYIPGENAEVSTTISGLKMQILPPHSHSKFPMICEEVRGIVGKIVDYCKFN